MRQRVAVVGAAGFVGRAVVARLIETHDVTALTQRQLIEPPPARAGLEWRKCDLFSQIDIEQGIAGAQCAIYLVHSLLPSARLVQGNVADRELILASNFAQCAAKTGLRQIVHVIPRTDEDEPEVARVLRAGSVPVTTLKSSAILGLGGAAFQLLDGMTSRSKTALLPEWAWTDLAPVDIGDLSEVIVRCILNEETFGRTGDIAAAQPASLAFLLETLAQMKGRRWRAVRVRGRWERTAGWLFSRAASLPKARVRALLRGWMTRPPSLDVLLQTSLGVVGRPVEESLQAALAQPAGWEAKRPLRGFHERDVRSIQRLPLPPGWSAAAVARAYAAWLPRFLFPFVRVTTSSQNDLTITLRGFSEPILELRFAPSRSTAERQLFYISGGSLARSRPDDVRPRLEFREVPGQASVIAAIHDFAPRLPWAFYRTTQALVHLGVMRSFSKYLRAKATP